MQQFKTNINESPHQSLTALRKQYKHKRMQSKNALVSHYASLSLMAGDDFGKLALMAAMRGQAAQSVKPYSYGTPRWNGNVAYAAYYARIREVFLPPQESELARVEFRS